MESINQFSFAQLLVTGAILSVIYILIRFIYSILNRAFFSGAIHKFLKNNIHALILVFEPIALLILLTVFILINVVFHGMLVLLVLIFGFVHIRSYVSGQNIKFDQALVPGKQLSTQNYEGIIAEIGKFGLKLKTGQGVQFIDYSNLISKGYSILSTEEFGGYYQISVQAKEGESIRDFRLNLWKSLGTVPYLDWSHKPEMVLSEDLTHVQLKVIVKEENHLYDLIALIKEWGYPCKIYNQL